MFVEGQREFIFVDLDHQNHSKTEPMSSRIHQGQGTDLLLVMQEALEPGSSMWEPEPSVVPSVKLSFTANGPHAFGQVARHSLVIC